LDLAKYAAENGLKRVGARPPFFAFLKESWQRREFALALATFTSASDNARNRLGRWWLIITPALQGGLYGIVFGFIMGSENRPLHFIEYLFCGVFLFSFMQQAFTSGATSVTSNAGLVKSLSFPRVLLPIAATIKQFINFLPQLGLLLLTIVLFGNPVTWQWLLIVPATLLMLLFGVGSSMLAARMTVQFPDLNKLLPFLFRLAFYASGVFFSIEKILANYPVALEIMRFNPYSSFMDLARGLLIRDYSVNAATWWICAGWAILLPLISVVLFWRVEERHGRED
jgi:teichoic acid transport system permease protein